MIRDFATYLQSYTYVTCNFKCFVFHFSDNEYNIGLRILLIQFKSFNMCVYGSSPDCNRGCPVSRELFVKMAWQWMV